SAVATAANGDTIVLAPGTYQPTATLDPPHSITLQGPNSGTAGATITGASVPADSDVLDVDSGVSVTIRNLTFTSALASAATVFSQGTLLVEASTFTGNQGPVLDLNDAIATIRNSTISGNADDAVIVGGILPPCGQGASPCANPTLLENDTITSNAGNGIQNASLSTNITLRNSIVWGNTLGDCVATVEISDHSLDGDDTCGVEQPALNPLLGTLPSNGGTTQTRALQTGSPAVDAGTSPCPFSPAVDQRGNARDGLCDLGAYENADTHRPSLTLPPSVSATAPSPIGAVVSYTATASDPDRPLTPQCLPASGSLFPLRTPSL